MKYKKKPAEVEALLITATNIDDLIDFLEESDWRVKDYQTNGISAKISLIRIEGGGYRRNITNDCYAVRRSNGDCFFVTEEQFLEQYEKM